MWSDMFADVPVDILEEYHLGDLVTPVIWGYNVDVTMVGYFDPRMFERFAQVTNEMRESTLRIVRTTRCYVRSTNT